MIKLNIGNTRADINGREIVMDIPVIVVNGLIEMFMKVIGLKE